MSNIEHITVAVPVELATIIKHAVESGDYASSSEVFHDAIRDWKYKRELQQQEVQQIRAGVAQGFTDLAAGHTKPSEEVFARLEKKYQNMQ